MGREVRRVPADWQHPKNSKGRHTPLYDDYRTNVEEFAEKVLKDGVEEANEYFDGGPLRDDYMPDWPKDKCTHYQMYETCSEGTPISPVMETPDRDTHRDTHTHKT